MSLSVCDFFFFCPHAISATRSTRTEKTSESNGEKDKSRHLQLQNSKLFYIGLGWGETTYFLFVHERFGMIKGIGETCEKSHSCSVHSLGSDTTESSTCLQNQRDIYTIHTFCIYDLCFYCPRVYCVLLNSSVSDRKETKMYY